MGERLKTIEEYYANLEYEQIINNNAREKMTALINKLNFENKDNFQERFLKTAFIIEQNLSFFCSFCKHPDTITTIVKYLNYFGTRLTYNDKYDEYEKNDVILLVILTIFEMCCTTITLSLKMFLDTAIIKNSLSIQNNLIHSIRNDSNEMILFGDSDLYAVISYLKNQKDIQSLNKIWVQELIRDKFLWLVTEYLDNFVVPICTFRKKKQLFVERKPDTMNIVSIWTEDIVFAKSLAISLDKDVVFINTYMDFYDGIVLLPYKQMINALHKSNPTFDFTKEQIEQTISVYNLFYNGMWQKPETICGYLLTITSDDIKKFIDSVKKGFKIWSSKSLTDRVNILSQFASTLKYSGKSNKLTILNSIKLSCIYENLSSCSQNGRLEVTKVRNPKGVIILKEKDEDVLLHRLIQILTVGNSAIIICNINSHDLAYYHNIFSTFKIPNVINIISSSAIEELESFLLGMSYTECAEKLFSEVDPEKIYINLTKSKQIIIPLV